MGRHESVNWRVNRPCQRGSALDAVALRALVDAALVDEEDVEADAPRLVRDLQAGGQLIVLVLAGFRRLLDGDGDIEMPVAGQIRRFVGHAFARAVDPPAIFLRLIDDADIDFAVAGGDGDRAGVVEVVVRHLVVIRLRRHRGGKHGKGEYRPQRLHAQLLLLEFRYPVRGTTSMQAAAASRHWSIGAGAA